MKTETFAVDSPAPAPQTITVSITLTLHEARDLRIRGEEDPQHPEHPVVEKVRTALRAARS